MPELFAEYFTDPFCPWCWTEEPRYRKLRMAFGRGIFWEHRMGGMEGTVPQVTDPEVAARKMERISLDTGMPIDLNVWRTRPPESSIAASIAVKAASFQGPEVEDAYLRRVREAFFCGTGPVDRSAPLVHLARGVPGIDLHRFVLEMHDRGAKKAFMTDWDAARDPVPEARDLEDTPEGRRYAFPTLLLRNRDGESRVLDQKHEYADWLQAVAELAPGLEPEPSPSIEMVLRRWDSVATAEVALICELPWDTADEALDLMAERGGTACRPVGHFALWSPHGGVRETGREPGVEE